MIRDLARLALLILLGRSLAGFASAALQVLHNPLLRPVALRSQKEFAAALDAEIA